VPVPERKPIPGPLLKQADKQELSKFLMNSALRLVGCKYAARRVILTFPPFVQTSAGEVDSERQAFPCNTRLVSANVSLT
jgi:hypothetical protein